MNHIYSKIYDYTKNIKPAPDPHYMLDKFYGNLTIQEKGFNRANGKKKFIEKLGSYSHSKYKMTNALAGMPASGGQHKKAFELFYHSKEWSAQHINARTGKIVETTLKALNFTQEEIVKLQELYFPKPTVAKPNDKELPPIEDKMPLKSLFYFIKEGKIEIQLVALSSKGNDYSKKETWELDVEGWKMIASEFAGVSAEVVYDNPNEVKLPKGNIIINTK
jgi:hypothetical protein